MIELFLSSDTRLQWREYAYRKRYHEIKKRFSKPLRDPARIGAVGVEEGEGLEGYHFWMIPVEGYRKLLSPKSQVMLFDYEGKEFYRGEWQGVGEGEIKPREKFFVWVMPRGGIQKKPSGFVRLLSHLRAKILPRS